MISNALAKLADIKTSLTLQTDLFAENIPVNKGVCFKAVRNEKLNDININIRESMIKMFVQGYTYVDGYKIAEQVVQSLDGYKGVIVVSGDMTYNILSLNAKTLPLYVNDHGLNVFVVNFNVAYRTDFTF